MISLEECRKILGDAAHDLSDAELELLRQQFYGLADIAVSCSMTTSDKGVTLPSKEAIPAAASPLPLAGEGAPLARGGWTRADRER